jgi:ParB family transcriptional regulator, chromosome partitioning protein
VNKPKRGLGRGLDALISSTQEESPERLAVEVPISTISPNPYQPRHLPENASLEELAQSIKEHGIIQPLVVARHLDHYQIIAGERRWRAAQLAGLTSVPVIIKDSTPQQMLELALVENIQRADLNPLEEASAYQQLITEFSLTQEEVAVKVGKNRATVANTLRLLKLPEAIQNALAAEQISEGHARAILSLPDASAQQELMELVIKGDLNVRQTEAMARKMLQPEPPARPQPIKTRLSPDDLSAINTMEAQLGTNVMLERSKKGGRLIIHFYSEEELHSIYEIITHH